MEGNEAFMKKEDFIEILSSITPNEMHNFIEQKDTKRKLIDAIVVINNTNNN